ncbi:hypothetical protein [Streptomyces sp. NPDC015131]|uniref:hypothetical protein n=1 Tax=Streptomyces sp. NPDC015131 TaxID=3364941 RepID=UPI0036FFE099
MGAGPDLTRTVRIAVSDRTGRAAPPGHPEAYEIGDPGEVREVLSGLAGWTGPEDFVCMCRGSHGLTLYDAAGRAVRTLDVHEAPPLLDPAAPGSIPARHRTAWAAAAPGPLRGYADGWAYGRPPAPGAVADVPLELVLAWLGAPPPGDGAGTWGAARRIARLAPLAVLDAAPTADVARAAPRAGTAGLDGAVEFFASEHFTARHPKKRRVAADVRDLLVRHARTSRPQHVAVLERRLLRARG